MASEVDAIENDWQAIGWAFGGLRVLFYFRPKPLGTLQELNAAAQSYADRRRMQVNNVWLARNLGTLTVLLSALTSLPKVFHGSHRAANAVMVAGLLTLAFLLYLISREPNVPDRDDASGLIRFYRKELARTADISSPAFWLIPAMVAIAVGFQLSVTYPRERFLGLLWFGILLLLFSGQRSNRRRLDQIDALLATHGGL